MPVVGFKLNKYRDDFTKLTISTNKQVNELKLVVMFGTLSHNMCTRLMDATRQRTADCARKVMDDIIEDSYWNMIPIFEKERNSVYYDKTPEDMVNTLKKLMDESEINTKVVINKYCTTVGQFVFAGIKPWSSTNILQMSKKLRRFAQDCQYDFKKKRGRSYITKEHCKQGLKRTMLTCASMNNDIPVLEKYFNEAVK